MRLEKSVIFSDGFDDELTVTISRAMATLIGSVIDVHSLSFQENGLPVDLSEDEIDLLELSLSSVTNA